MGEWEVGHMAGTAHHRTILSFSLSFGNVPHHCRDPFLFLPRLSSSCHDLGTPGQNSPSNCVLDVLLLPDSAFQIAAADGCTCFQNGLKTEKGGSHKRSSQHFNIGSGEPRERFRSAFLDN